jgi:hypothetical protein
VNSRSKTVRVVTSTGLKSIIAAALSWILRIIVSVVINTLLIVEAEPQCVFGLEVDMAYPEISQTFCDNAPRYDGVPNKIMAPVPQAALERLSHLHAESRLALRRSRLMARAVPAAGSLLVMGVGAALGGNAPMAPTFIWSLLVILGIGAVLRNHMRATSNLAGSASDLRAIFLYLGLVWGSGAFLALAPSAAALPWVLGAFAATPCLTLILLLGDFPAILAFAVPVTLMTITAALVQGGFVDVVPLLLLQGTMTLLLFRNRPRWGNIPAGLVLR